MTPELALEIAKRICGGPNAMAKTIGTSRQNVTAWKIIPVKWVPKVVEAVADIRRQCTLTAHDCRPDKFPKGRRASGPSK